MKGTPFTCYLSLHPFFYNMIHYFDVVIIEYRFFYYQERFDVIKNRQFRTYLLTGILIAVMALFFVAPARAAEIIDDDDTIIIDEDIADDVYAFAETIIVNGTIEGDLIAFGQSLELNGTVTGDVAFFGGWATINGEVQDDLRSGAYLVTIGRTGIIGDDLLAGAGAVQMEAGAAVGGDLYAAASKVSVGDVAGNVGIGAESIRVNGTIGGDASLSYSGASSYTYDWTRNMPPEYPAIQSIPQGLTFGTSGEIAGDLNYTTDNPFDGIEQYVSGQTTFSQVVTDAYEGETASVVHPFVRYLGRAAGFIAIGALMSLIALKLFPGITAKSLETLKTQTGASFGVGVLGYLGWWFLLGVFGLLLFGLMALGGLNTGFVGPVFRGVTLLGTSIWAIFMLVTKWLSIILFALLIGKPLHRMLASDEGAPYLSFLLGLVVVALLVSIPFLSGLLLTPVIRAFTLGAFLLAYWPRRQSDAPKMAEAASVLPETSLEQ